MKMYKHILILLAYGLGLQLAQAHLYHFQKQNSFTPPRAKNFTVNGIVKDKTSGETLIGATVYVKSLNKGTVTNAYGFYALTLPKGNYQVTFSYIGYRDIRKVINLNSSKRIDIEMVPASDALKEIVVTDRKMNDQVTNVEMSVEKLDIQQIKSMPAFLGEVDVIKSITTLPGVSTVGEGTTGFNVRGGGVDQNLILLDEATVYNSSHLFGLFSVFNPDAVKDVKLYKGALPARYGGRLSSVLDIRQKEGDMKRFKAQGGIGLISSRLTLETPLVKDKSSLIIAGRRSYADAFLFLSGETALQQTKAYFYDLNTKFNYIINKNNRIYVSGYFGRDRFKLGGSGRSAFSFDWGNTSATIRWNHMFGKNLFSNVSAIYSDYNYRLGIPNGAGTLNWQAGIRNYQLKNDLSWFIAANYTLDFGFSGILYEFSPGKVNQNDPNIGINNLNIANERAFEGAVYVNSEYVVNPFLTLTYGVRYSTYYVLGPGDVRSYQAGLPKSPENVTEVRSYKNNEVIRQYGGWEPRLGFRLKINDQNSIKLSYGRNRQYIHLISNTTAPTPVDIWKSSNTHIKPQLADQLAIGYFRNMDNGRYEFSLEGYYKDMQNLIDYKNGAELILNETIETDLLSGNGRAYGLEFMLKKNTGKWTGWLSYTLSRTERKIDGVLPEERINNGAFYPADYDKPHNIKLVLNYQAAKRLSFSLNFMYNTGRPITFPDAKYNVYGSTIIDYSQRNQNRIPDYHRLDLSMTLKRRKRPNRRWEGEWVFSLFNVYARKNAYSLYFAADGVNKNEATKLSILGTIFPSVTYNFKF